MVIKTRTTDAKDNREMPVICVICIKGIGEGQEYRELTRVCVRCKGKLEEDMTTGNRLVYV